MRTTGEVVEWLAPVGGSQEGSIVRFATKLQSVPHRFHLFLSAANYTLPQQPGRGAAVAYRARFKACRGREHLLPGPGPYSNGIRGITLARQLGRKVVSFYFSCFPFTVGCVYLPQSDAAYPDVLDSGRGKSQMEKKRAFFFFNVSHWFCSIYLNICCLCYTVRSFLILFFYLLIFDYLLISLCFFIYIIMCYSRARSKR